MIDCLGNELLPEDSVVVHTSDGLRVGYIAQTYPEACRVMVVDKDVTCRFFVNPDHIVKV